MKEQLLKTLENSKNYTLAVAEAMPENAYDTKPTDGIWNFRELMHHIAYSFYWYADNSINGVETEWNPTEVKNNKADVINYLKQGYDYLENSIKNNHTNATAVAGFYSTLDHTTHHRGQATTYLRHQGIVPPDYVY